MSRAAFQRASSAAVAGCERSSTAELTSGASGAGADSWARAACGAPNPATTATAAARARGREGRWAGAMAVSGLSDANVTQLTLR